MKLRDQIAGLDRKLERIEGALTPSRLRGSSTHWTALIAGYTMHESSNAGETGEDLRKAIGRSASG